MKPKEFLLLRKIFFRFCLQFSEPQHGKDEANAVAKDGKHGKGREKFIDGFGKQECNQHPETADQRGQTKNPQGTEGSFGCIRILTEFLQQLGFACKKLLPFLLKKIGERKHQNDINQHGVAPFGSVFISVAFYRKKSKFLFAREERYVMICPDGI